jgi:hypothetical protein
LTFDPAVTPITSDLRMTSDLLTYATSATLRDLVYHARDPDDDLMAWIRH